jgi:hypothetical protein
MLGKFVRKQDNLWAFFAIVVAVVWTLIVLWPSLVDSYRVAGDFCNFYWMAKFQDPTLFDGDPLVFGRRLVELNLFGKQVTLYPVSLGYALLFYFASYFLEPILFSKILVFVLITLSIHYLFKLGKKYSGDDTSAFILSVFFTFYTLNSHNSLTVASGLQRAFALPLLILCVYFLEERQFYSVAWLLPLSALIYVPVLPVIGLVYLLVIFEYWGVKGFTKYFWRRQVLPFGASVGLTIPIVFWTIIERFDVTRTSSSLVIDDYHQKYLLGGWPLFGKSGLFVRVEEFVHFIALALLWAMIWLVLKKHRIGLSDVLKKLMLSGMIMYAIALGAIYFFSTDLFYQPSRYSRVVLTLTILVSVGLNYKKFLISFPHWFSKNMKAFFGSLLLLIVGVGILFILLYPKNYPQNILILALFFPLAVIELIVFLFLGTSGKLLYQEFRKKDWTLTKTIAICVVGSLSLLVGVVYTRLFGYSPINPTKDERALLSYVATTPKSALFAGEPDFLTNIPLFSKRKVLLKGLHTRTDAPVDAAMDVYYAENSSKILSFCQAHDVDYLIRDNRDFETENLEKGRFFILTRNEELKEDILSRSNFILPHVEPEFQQGALGVIKCDEELFE